MCLLLKARGVLAKPTHQNVIRFAPPLVISEADLQKAINVILRALDDFDTVRRYVCLNVGRVCRLGEGVGMY